MTEAGQVIVFNCFSEPMTMLSVNGASVGTIDAWNTGASGLRYAPAGLAVPRAVNAAEQQFFDGNNEVIVDWMGEVFHFDVAIDGDQHPLVESLALFILRSGFSLLNGFGVQIAAGPLLVGPAVVPAPVGPPPPAPPPPPPAARGGGRNG
jgi:hypothetical protein